MQIWLGRAACALLAVGLMLSAAGCGPSVGQPEGKITLKGEPVAGAQIVFLPESNPDTVVYGVTGPDGRYVLDFGTRSGVLVGKAKVRITRHTLPNGKPLPTGEEGAALKNDSSKSVSHTVVFEKDVVSGPNAIDFELSEGKKE